MERRKKLGKQIEELRRQVADDAAEFRRALFQVRDEMRADSSAMRAEVEESIKALQQAVKILEQTTRNLEQQSLRQQSHLEGLAATTEAWQARADARYSHLLDILDYEFRVADQEREALRQRMDRLFDEHDQRLRRLEERRPPAA